MTEPCDLGAWGYTFSFCDHIILLSNCRRGRHQIAHRIATFIPLYLLSITGEDSYISALFLKAQEQWRNALPGSQPFSWNFPCKTRRCLFALSLFLPFFWSEIQRIRQSKWIKRNAGHVKTLSFVAAKRKCLGQKRIARLPWKRLLMRNDPHCFRKGSQWGERGGGACAAQSYSSNHSINGN